MKSTPVLMAVSGALLLGLSACATTGSAPSTAAKETISYSVGPCFGFCPVYTVSVTPAGHVAYTGERHTAVLGDKGTEGGARAYTAMANGLAGFRPATGTTEDTQCDQRMTDQSNYRIVWTAADGTETVLRHDLGCRSARNDALNAVLRDLPQQLGIADWAKPSSNAGDPPA